jgi:hypothetical protein
MHQGEYCEYCACLGLCVDPEANVLFVGDYMTFKEIKKCISRHQHSYCNITCLHPTASIYNLSILSFGYEVVIICDVNQFDVWNLFYRYHNLLFTCLDYLVVLTWSLDQVVLLNSILQKDHFIVLYMDRHVLVFNKKKAGSKTRNMRYYIHTFNTFWTKLLEQVTLLISTLASKCAPMSKNSIY